MAEGVSSNSSVPDALGERERPGGGDARPEDLLPRAELPEVLLSEDVAKLLRITLGAARKLIARGDCGPHSRLGRRLVVRRDTFLETLKIRESLSMGTRRARPIPQPRAETMEFLRGKRKRGRG